MMINLRNYLVPCNSRSLPIKEHGDGVGAYVAAGAEVVGGVDETTDFDAFLDFFHDIEGVFVSVCVGDSDDLFFRFYDVVTDEGDVVRGGRLCGHGIFCTGRCSRLCFRAGSV